MAGAEAVSVNAGEHVSDWVSGDIIVAANETEQPADFRAGLRGRGRLLHCDARLNVKRELKTGRDGLVIGAYLHEGGRLFATSPQLFEVDCFNASMQPVPVRLPLRRRYGNLVSDRKGGILVGIHSGYGDPEGGHDDALGEGRLVRFDPDTGAAEAYNVEVDGGRGGKHYVSSLAVTDDGEIVFYSSEAGKRVLRYDLERRVQLPDFYFAGEGEALTYGLDVNANGQVLLATGNGANLFDSEGRLQRRYRGVAESGWTRAAFSRDDETFFFSNFLEGILERRSLESGEIVDVLETGLSGAVTTAIEVSAALVSSHQEKA